MKTWVSMYAIIWVALLEILLVLFPVFGFTLNVALHAVLGAVIFAFAFYIRRGVRRTACPDRIKRIATTTFGLAILQGVLGVLLFAAINYAWGTSYVTIINFLHVINSIAIITQASSSATAYDMWEEKEFQSLPA